MKTYRTDIAIVGAGPAGSLCAYLLAKSGRKVLLIDRSEFPRYKVCGSCLAPAALQILEKVELATKVIPADAPELHSMRIRCGSSVATLSLPRGRAVSRRQLDANLLTAAKQAGASVQTRTQFIRIIDHSSKNVEFEIRKFRNGKSSSTSTVTAALLIDASGLAAAVMRHFSTQGAVRLSSDLVGIGVTLPATTLTSGVIEMNIQENGYIGAVSVDGGFLDIAAACPANAVKETSLAMAQLSIKCSAHDQIKRDQLNLRGTPALSRFGPIAFGRCIAIGDSACYHEPFTGQGMSWALASAYEFTRLVKRVGLEKAALTWPSCYQSTIRPQMGVCRAFGTLRRAQFLGPRFVAALRTFPTIANLFTHYAWKNIELHS